jgi:type I restriction enzyme S subunit
MTLVPREELNSRYFRYQLTASRPALEALGQGATFVELSSGSLRSFRVVAPSAEVQTRVADFLDYETARIDAVIERRRELIRLSRLRRGALLANAVLGRLGDSVARIEPTGNPSIPELPVGWRTARLRHVVAQTTVGVVVTPAAFYADEGLPFLRGFNVRPGVVTDYDLARISSEGNALHPKSILQIGDVLVVRTGQTGAAAVVPDWAVGGNCVDVLIVRCGRSLRPQFLEFVLNSEHAARQIDAGSVGAIQSHFNVGALRDLVLPVPPVVEQDRIVALVEKEDALVLRLMEAAGHQVGLLLEHRQALITAAVTGQIDVSGRVARLPPGQSLSA